MLLKLPLDLVPLRKDWALVKAGTYHKEKKLRRFHTFQPISFLVTMLKRISYL